MDAYPPTSFYFRVSIGGSNTPFQEVGGIGPEMETEAYHEGGENRFVHALPKGVKHPKLSLKRGVAPFDAPLVTWCRDTLEGGLGARIEPKMVLLFLQDEDGRPLRQWRFEHAFPTKWSVDEFRADKSAVAIEKVELSYATAYRRL